MNTLLEKILKEQNFEDIFQFITPEESVSIDIVGKSILEGKADVLKKYVETGKLSKDIFQLFFDGDPTPQKKYLDWMAKTYIANPERPEHLVDVIKLFNDGVVRKQIDNLDLYSYKNVDELEKEALSASKKVSKRQTRLSQEKEATILRDDDKMMILVPESYESSQFYGKRTKWCTAIGENDVYWRSYFRQKTKLYYILDKSTNMKYAVLVQPSGEKTVYDMNDNVISFEKLRKLLDI